MDAVNHVLILCCWKNTAKIKKRGKLRFKNSSDVLCGNLTAPKLAVIHQRNYISELIRELKQ